MTERPWHRLDCPCDACLRPFATEPTWKQVVVLVIIVASGLGLAWWGLTGPLW